MEKSIIIENIGGREELKAALAEVITEHFGNAKPKEDKFLSRKEVKEKLGVCYPTVDAALKNGDLKGYRIGGRILLKESELNLSRFVKSK